MACQRRWIGRWKGAHRAWSRPYLRVTSPTVSPDPKFAASLAGEFAVFVNHGQYDISAGPAIAAVHAALTEWRSEHTNNDRPSPEAFAPIQEREVRALLTVFPRRPDATGDRSLDYSMPTPDGTIIHADLNTLVAEVRVAPTAPDWLADVVDWQERGSWSPCTFVTASISGRQAMASREARRSLVIVTATD
jgi:hypothetical protein